MPELRVFKKFAGASFAGSKQVGGRCSAESHFALRPLPRTATPQSVVVMDALISKHFASTDAVVGAKCQFARREVERGTHVDLCRERFKV